MSKLICFFIVLFLNLSSFASPNQALGEIKWKKWSPAVFELAKKEHKRVLIYGKVSWCHWCQKMDNYSFSDPAVVQLVSRYYIPVKVDIEQEVSVSNRYNITEIPSLIILDAHKKELKRFYGYASAQSLISKLEV